VGEKIITCLMSITISPVFNVEILKPQHNVPPKNGPNDCAIAKSFILGIDGVLALANKYGQNHPFAHSPSFLLLYVPQNLTSASTPMSLCLIPTCNVFTPVVTSIFSSSGNMCSRIPLSIACSTIWKTPYFTTVLAAIAPAPEFTISAIKLSAPKAPVMPSATPSTSGAPTKAKVVKRTASR
jgi:hypothetical protein